MAGKGPLTGYKVLDFTQFESGTVCTESLAWMGAEVWKVERPEKGEAGRYSYDPTKDLIGFTILNMNKKSITVNLKSPEGIALIKQLIPKVDVIVENMGPGAFDRLGLSYEECKALNPKVVYASIKGFSKGPYEHFPAFNPVAASMGGLPAVNGEPDGMPYQIGISFADSGTGYMCAMAILGALLQVEREGIGQRIDVAMTDTVIAFARMCWETYYNTGKPPRRPGNGMPLEDIAPCDMYPCKGGGKNDYVYIYTSRHPGSKQWDMLCDVIGHPELKEANDERMKTPHSRYKYKDVITKVISEWTMQYDKMEAMRILCEGGVPTGAVRDVEDITKDESHFESGFMAEVDCSLGHKIRVPGFAPRMSENHVEYETNPKLGGANEEIFKEVLGLSDEKYNELKANKVI